MIEVDAFRFIRLGVILLTGGLSSAASIGALVHTHKAKQQMVQEEALPTAFYEHRAGDALPIVALGTHLKVYQTNGSMVEGTVQATHAQWLKLAVPELGALTISQEKIARIEGLGVAQHQPLRFNDQRLNTGTTLAPRQRARQTRRNDHDYYQEARSAYESRQYEQAERAAQRALEQLRGDAGAQRQEMKRVIQESRKVQARIHQQQKAQEASLAQQQKEQEEREWERNKWKTSFDDSPSQGKFTPIRRVRSSSAATSSASNVGGTTIYVPQGYSEHIEVQNAKVVEVPDGHKVVYRPDGTQTFEPATECDKAMSNYESTGYLPSNCR